MSEALEKVRQVQSQTGVDMTVAVQKLKEADNDVDLAVALIMDERNKLKARHEQEQKQREQKIREMAAKSEKHIDRATHGLKTFSIFAIIFSSVLIVVGVLHKLGFVGGSGKYYDRMYNAFLYFGIFMLLGYVLLLFLMKGKRYKQKQEEYRAMLEKKALEKSAAMVDKQNNKEYRKTGKNNKAVGTIIAVAFILFLVLFVVDFSNVVHIGICDGLRISAVGRAYNNIKKQEKNDVESVDGKLVSITGQYIIITSYDKNSNAYRNADYEVKEIIEEGYNALLSVTVEISVFGGTHKSTNYYRINTKTGAVSEVPASYSWYSEYMSEIDSFIKKSSTDKNRGYKANIR